MKEPFITSDPHFFHENICKWPGARPWDCHEEMTRDMIARWNSVVSEDDKVIILGDLFNRKAIECMPLLKGRKVLVMGNHCQAPTMVYMENGIEKLLSCYEIAGGILTHIPIHTSQLERWKWNGIGHLHHADVMMLDEENNLVPDPRYLNFCVEKWDYTPIKLSVGLNELRKRGLRV